MIVDNARITCDHPDAGLACPTVTAMSARTAQDRARADGWTVHGHGPQVGHHCPHHATTDDEEPRA